MATSLRTTSLTIEPIDSETWRVSGTIKIDEGQHISITLDMKADPRKSLLKIEDALFQEASKRLFGTELD